jgi:hypothetical protein
MSRSRRLPIIKGKPRNYKRTALYWRKIRRVNRMKITQGEDPVSPKLLINDYDYCDYVLDFRYYNSPSKIKAKRK